MADLGEAADVSTSSTIEALGDYTNQAATHLDRIQVTFIMTHDPASILTMLLRKPLSRATTRYFTTRWNHPIF